MANRQRRVTMMDVAERAGVAKATVARVVNDHPNVNEKIRQRVIHAIEELSYRPSRVCRAKVQAPDSGITD